MAELASAQLRLRVGALLRGVRSAIARREARIKSLSRPEIAEVAITAQHAQVLLAEAERYASNGRAYGCGAAFTALEDRQVRQLDERAATAGIQLPDAVLAARGLSVLDRQVLVLGAAPTLEPSFGPLYGFLNDLRSCTALTPSIGVEVLAVDAHHEQRVLTACGPFGTLRADGWLTASLVEGGSTSLLRPGEGVIDLLAGAPVDTGLLGRVDPPVSSVGIARATLRRAAAVAAAFRAGDVDVVGVWGPAHGGRAAVVSDITGTRSTVIADGLVAGGDVDRALHRAAVTRSVCVLTLPQDPATVVDVIERVTRSAVPVVVVADEPVRATQLICRRNFAEVSLDVPGFAERRTSWSAAFPGLDTAAVDDLAGRFRLLPDEIEAVARFDAACSTWATNGDRPGVDALAGLVSRRRSPRVATIRTPRRGRDVLVLPPAELSQVLDVAAAARAWPRIADAWRLDRFGNPGIVALFTGDPGTGKTLAAEVIATEIGLSLMEVDLSRLVSKWLGDTEKHLDAVFTEAEASNCVLFFDEADSLFGQRGEVTRGSDRYANVEVGYLLQRLERYEGLVILASNLRGNLDPAFTRRFHHVVHFPRPTEAERRRLWEIALAPPVELAGPIDYELLAGVELTGAGIAAVVRTAGLAAAHDTAHTVGGPAPLRPLDLVAAIHRQFQREARLLPSEQLGRYARLL
jgi:ATPase family associated with various cellular activities (AAA)